ncbi:hypothetical protein [Paenarthrobacter sp. NPDC091669]|uniref:hypothetical protein n=1 Tax=Paenarthrobacter sp. NPDC091669 TaxID=3364384 RepID=UPI0037FD3AE5
MFTNLTRSISTKAATINADIRADEVQNWMKTMTAMGVELGHLSPVDGYMAKAATLEQYARRYKEANGLDEAAAAQTLAAEPCSYEAAAALVTTTALANTDDYLEDALDTFAEAVRINHVHAFRVFRNRSDDTVEALQTVLTNTANRIQESAESIPAATKDIAEATRAGVGEAWVQLERDLNTLDAIASLIAEWYSYGALKNDGRRNINEYSLNELMYEDSHQISINQNPATAAGMAMMLSRARAVVLARPKIHTPAEADAKHRGAPNSAQLDAFETAQDKVHAEVAKELGTTARRR